MTRLYVLAYVWSWAVIVLTVNAIMEAVRRG